jgi:hypothetical protein
MVQYARSFANENTAHVPCGARVWPQVVPSGTSTCPEPSRSVSSTVTGDVPMFVTSQLKRCPLLALTNGVTSVAALAVPASAVVTARAIAVSRGVLVDGVRIISVSSSMFCVRPLGLGRGAFEMEGTMFTRSARTSLPLRATLVLDPPTATTGECVEAGWPAAPPAPGSCVAVAGGAGVKCR